MPPDHLTTAPPHQVAAGVLAVLGGTGLATAATERGMDPTDLADAIQVYQAAGLAALDRRAEREWYQTRIYFRDWTEAETIAAVHLAPDLGELQANGATTGWWFLRKHPCWRLRLRNADPSAVTQTLDELTATGVLASWQPSIYEPEAAAFGGPAAIGIVHDLFCADSRGVLDYAACAAPGLGRRELSLLLVNALALAAGLDWFERGDVFNRVAQLRPTPADADTTRVDDLAARLRRLLIATGRADGMPLSTRGPAGFASAWIAAFTTAGRQLGEAATRGDLDRGLRAILAHIVIFHWNRLGLSTTTQAILAHAALAAILPRS